MADHNEEWIFISYRRKDSQRDVGRIHDHLAEAFTPENVFFDTDDIEPGDVFPKHIKTAADACIIMLVIIGPDWVSIKDEHGNTRLNDPKDWVRKEVQIGLRGKKVIPVLINDTQILKKEQLPRTLRAITDIHVQHIRNADFKDDIQRLIKRIEAILGKRGLPPPLVEPAIPVPEAEKPTTTADENTDMTEKKRPTELAEEKVIDSSTPSLPNSKTCMGIPAILLSFGLIVLTFVVWAFGIIPSADLIEETNLFVVLFVVLVVIILFLIKRYRRKNEHYFSQCQGVLFCLVLLLISLILLLFNNYTCIGCPLPPTITPTNIPTQTPTDTPTSIPTNTSSQTPTDTPTQTPTGTIGWQIGPSTGTPDLYLVIGDRVETLQRNERLVVLGNGQSPLSSNGVEEISAILNVIRSQEGQVLAQRIFWHVNPSSRTINEGAIVLRYEQRVISRLAVEPVYDSVDGFYYETGRIRLSSRARGYIQDNDILEACEVIKSEGQIITFRQFDPPIRFIVEHVEEGFADVTLESGTSYPTIDTFAQKAIPGIAPCSFNRTVLSEIPTHTPTPTSTFTPSSTSTSTATHTPTATPTPSPSDTPTDTPTFTPTDFPTPDPVRTVLIPTVTEQLRDEDRNWRTPSYTKPFRIDIYETSRTEFLRFLQALQNTPNGNMTSIFPNGVNVSDVTSAFGNLNTLINAASLRGNLPISGLTGRQAQLYCQWLGGDLPTIDQWEVAALWDTERRRLRSDYYPWGPEGTWIGKENIEQSTAVPLESALWDVMRGQANDGGFYNMGGNVSEWVRTNDDDHTYAIRGGHVYSQIDSEQSITVYSNIEVSGTELVGFRCIYNE